MSVHHGGMYAGIGDASVRFVRTGVSAAGSRLFTFQLTTVVEGISTGGVDQLLRAEIITRSGDRLAIANAILRKLGFANPLSTIGPERLMPAVQKFREALGGGVREREISAIGALQLLSADPVSSPRDRTVLSGQECLVFFLGGRQSAFDPSFQGGVFVATR